MQNFRTTQLYSTTEEKNLWQNTIFGGVEFYDFLQEIDVSNEHVAKFIIILNGKRNLDDSHEDLKEFMNDAVDRQHLDNYLFHRKLKYFICDMDSCLDYLEKFCKKFNKNSKIKFHRDHKDISRLSNKVNNIRNSILHEGITKLKIRSKRVDNGCGCGAGGVSKVESNIIISIFNEGTDEKEEDAIELTGRLRTEITKILNNAVSQFIVNKNEFGSK